MPFIPDASIGGIAIKIICGVKIWIFDRNIIVMIIIRV